MNPIIPIYAELVKSGDKTIKQVPTQLRKDVQKLLDAGEANA
ncbi:CD1375 family protein [Sporosarcina sp. P34]|nr:CD1375 family protein [Sporosarcina sp. P34]